MDAQYRAVYGRLYREHWWWRARERLLEREVARLAGGRSLGRILDVGCGDGLFFPVLQRYGDPFGVEADEGLLNPAGEYRARIHSGPFDSSYQPTERFGMILALDVVEHVHDAPAFLRRASELLEPGGWFVVTVPAFRALWTSHDDINAHVTRYRRHELVALVRSAGLRVEHARYFFGWLALAKLSLHWIERVAGPSSKPPGFPPAPVNTLLELACRIEQALAGRSAMPFGSSLLLIARNDGGT